MYELQFGVRVYSIMCISPYRKEAISEDIEQTVADMQLIIELGRVIRDRCTLPVKVPLRRLIVVCDSADRLARVEAMKKYIVEVEL